MCPPRIVGPEEANGLSKGSPRRQSKQRARLSRELEWMRQGGQGPSAKFPRPLFKPRTDRLPDKSQRARGVPLWTAARMRA